MDLLSLAYLNILAISVANMQVWAHENPTISYCFSAITIYFSHHPIDCNLLQISNSSFKYGQFEQNVLNITSHALNNRKALILICQAEYPIRWLAHKPLNPLTKENIVFRQAILIELEDAFSRNLRCESLSNSTDAADLFLNTHEFPSPVWTTPDQLTANFLVDEDKDNFTVPCIAEEFHGNFTLNFIKRARIDLILDAEPSRECVNCTCLAKVTGNSTMTNDEHLASVREHPECLDGASTGSADTFIKRIGAASDCSRDGKISCREYSWAYISGGTPCGPGVKVDASPYRRFLSELQSCMIQPTIRRYDTRPDNYDPRIGFRLSEKPEFNTAYECSGEEGSSKDVKYALSSKFQRPASLVYVNGQMFCNAEANQFEFNLVIGNCSSVTECQLHFELTAPLILSRYYPYPEEDYELFSINGDNPNWITVEQSQGYVQCHGSYSKGDIEKVYFVKAVDYLFTGLNNQKYFALQPFPIESVITLSSGAIQNLSSSTWHNFTCKISTFVLVPNIQFIIEYVQDGGRKIVKPDEKRNALVTSEEHLNQAILVQHLQLKLSDDMSKIFCFAPWRNSSNWASTQVKLNLMKERLKGGSQVSSIAPYVVGGSIAVTLFLAITIWAGVLLKRNKDLKVAIRNLTQQEVDEFYNGVKDHSGEDAQVPVENKPFNRELRIPRESLTIGNAVLGEGEFGVVRQGKLDDITVAVKTCKDKADTEYFKAFLKEIKVMAFIGDHENVVHFFGAVVDDIMERKCAAVIELCPLGNLNGYLRKCSIVEPEGISNVGLYKNAPEFVLNKSCLIGFCKQIANGMDYLTKKRVLHGDLAARNLLVFHDNVIKITDFGLSRKLYNCASYVKTQQTPLPWRWMALESLRFFEFSDRSDVWSFGVTVWEIFSLAQVPFSGITWTTDFSDQLESGLRLSKPILASQTIYDWMLKCWHNQPNERPSFSQLHEFFQRSD